ncbi:MAG TPA: ACP S-malonyltransferase [Ktedonobacterales bacterium]|nr:ACP S-malonyltransferase [Ktedonobacterales bacterium]
MSKRIAFVFPGQGSQSVGMGADIFAASPAARAVYEAADAALGFSLSTLCFEGPEETLRETINTQPAIVATSLALLAALQEAARGGAASSDLLTGPIVPTFVAGHSVGEYAALAASGALDLTETLRLVRERGRLMHLEGERIPSGMAAVLGMDAPTLEAICAEATEQTRAALDASETHPGAGRVVLANDNAPGQIVISGDQRALDLAMELAKSRGARRVVPLAVSGAFHSPVMAPATEGLAQAVDKALIQDARVPLISNISAQPLTNTTDLRAELAQQIASPVQWTGTIEYLAGQGIETFVEIGAGQVLAGLIRRIAKDIPAVAVGNAAEVASASQTLVDAE